MKDYYYILGVKVESTEAEIKQAYRKLSLKFHPDKNEGDEYFSDRFKEIQEAYDTLKDSFKRTEYDRSRAQQSSNGQKSNLIVPQIVFFKCNKESFKYDEEVIFSWEVKNGDVVSILPIGLVVGKGQMNYKIKNYKNELLKFELLAENSLTKQKVSSILVLTNETHQEMKMYFSSLSSMNWKISKGGIKEFLQKNGVSSETMQKYKSGIKDLFVFIFYAILIVIIVFYILFLVS